ncbi:hypothetical protein KSS87_013436 [Heliosperma pusillum]|nr:hypothetical protein KSS87_013436 [Heliosperma pusillum]
MVYAVIVDHGVLSILLRQGQYHDCYCSKAAQPLLSYCISANTVTVSIGLHFYPIWEATSVDEWLYNGGPYELIVLHFLLGVACYMGREWELSLQHTPLFFFSLHWQLYSPLPIPSFFCNFFPLIAQLIQESKMENLIQNVKEQLVQLETQHPDKYDSIKIELRSFITRLDSQLLASLPPPPPTEPSSSYTPTQESTNVKRKSKDESRSSSDKLDALDDKLDALLDDARAYFRKYQD